MYTMLLVPKIAQANYYTNLTHVHHTPHVSSIHARNSNLVQS